jgi:hypothetical protein
MPSRARPSGTPAHEHPVKLSDYAFQVLVDRGIGDIFTLAGGGIVHLGADVTRLQRAAGWNRTTSIDEGLRRAGYSMAAQARGIIREQQ